MATSMRMNGHILAGMTERFHGASATSSTTGSTAARRVCGTPVIMCNVLHASLIGISMRQKTRSSILSVGVQKERHHT